MLESDHSLTNQLLTLHMQKIKDQSHFVVWLNSSRDLYNTYVLHKNVTRVLQPFL